MSSSGIKLAHMLVRQYNIDGKCNTWVSMCLPNVKSSFISSLDEIQSLHMKALQGNGSLADGAVIC
jgi:hypothetical protein